MPRFADTSDPDANQWSTVCLHAAACSWQVMRCPRAPDRSFSRIPELGAGTRSSGRCQTAMQLLATFIYGQCLQRACTHTNTYAHRPKEENCCDGTAQLSSMNRGMADTMYRVPGRTMGSLCSRGTSARLCSMLRRPDLNASPAAPSQAAGLISLAYSMHSSTRMRFSCVSFSGAAGPSSVPERIAAAQPSGTASLLSCGCAGAAVSSIGSKWHIRSVEDALQAACKDAASPFTVVGSSCIQCLACKDFLNHPKHNQVYI